MAAVGMSEQVNASLLEAIEIAEKLGEVATQAVTSGVSNGSPVTEKRAINSQGANH